MSACQHSFRPQRIIKEKKTTPNRLDQRQKCLSAHRSPYWPHFHLSWKRIDPNPIVLWMQTWSLNPSLDADHPIVLPCWTWTEHAAETWLHTKCSRLRRRQINWVSAAPSRQPSRTNYCEGLGALQPVLPRNIVLSDIPAPDLATRSTSFS